MKIVRSIQHALLLTLALVIAGCAALGQEKPQSAEDSLQYAKASLGAAYRTLGDMAASGEITEEHGIVLFKRLGQVKADLGLAERTLAGGMPNDALTTINLALTALLAIRSELAAKQKVVGAPSIQAAFT